MTSILSLEIVLYINRVNIMQKEKINEIIRYIFNNNVNDAIKPIFQRWLVSPNDQEIKSEVLNELWGAIPVESNKKGLQKLHNQINLKHNKVNLWRYCRKLAAIVIIGLSIFGSGYLTSGLFNKNSQKIHLVTASKSKGEFTLPDNTKVWLNSNSRLTYDDTFTRKSRNVKLEGEAFFEVTKDKEKAFNVQMNEVSIQVLGTKFNARNYQHEENEEVVLIEGSVKISGNEMTPIILKPNEKFTINRKELHVNVENTKSYNYSTWFNQYLSFEDTTLRDIFIQLERWYNVDITIDSKVDLDYRMSLKLNHESIEDILRVISKINGLKYNISTDKITILIKK